MQGDFIFRIITIILFIAGLAIGLYHRLAAARSSEKISWQKEGLLIMIFLRVFGFSAWIGLILYMINPWLMSWSAVALPFSLRWLGMGFAIVAIPLIYWMFSSIGKNVTDTVVVRKEHQLVMRGPYRWVRHPMYLFGFLALIGFTLLSANWFIGLTGSVALVILVLRTPLEEAELIAQFGDEYREYSKHTGKFLPRFLSHKNQQ